MRRKNRFDKIRKWIITSAEIIGIIAGVLCFYKLFNEGKDMLEQITQTTNIAKAINDQVAELKEQTKILEARYLIEFENTNFDKNSYVQKYMPFFISYDDSIKLMGRISVLSNIGHEAKILKIEYAIGNTFDISYLEDEYYKGIDIYNIGTRENVSDFFGYDKDEMSFGYQIGIGPEIRVHPIPSLIPSKMDLTIYSQTVEGKIFKQRIFDRKGRIISDNPILIK